MVLAFRSYARVSSPSTELSYYEQITLQSYTIGYRLVITSRPPFCSGFTLPLVQNNNNNNNGKKKQNTAP